MAKATQKESLNLGSAVHISDSEAIGHALAAQSQVQELRKMVTALKSDRETLLSEFTDLRNARPVPVAPARARAKDGKSSVRLSFGDLHGMRMDQNCVAALLQDIKLFDVDEIVFGGDMLECGGWLAKHQPIGYVSYSDYSYQEDSRAANWFLDEVQKAAPHAALHYLMGNHEDRVEKWIVDQTMAHQRDAGHLRDAYGPESQLRLAERGIRYYRRDEIYVTGYPRGWIKLGKMCFTHELGEGKQAASKSIDKVATNVTYFHSHKEDTATRVFPEAGIVKAFCPGCLCEMQPIWKHSDPSGWNQGYAVDFIAPSGNFQRVHVPIWRGESLANAMIACFKV